MKIKKKNRSPALKFIAEKNMRRFDFKKNKLLDKPIKEKFNKNDYLLENFSYRHSYSMMLWWNE